MEISIWEGLGLALLLLALGFGEKSFPVWVEKRDLENASPSRAGKRRSFRADPFMPFLPRRFLPWRWKCLARRISQGSTCSSERCSLVRSPFWPSTSRHPRRARPSASLKAACTPARPGETGTPKPPGQRGPRAPVTCIRVDPFCLRRGHKGGTTYATAKR